jgi:hypothetical protein
MEYFIKFGTWLTVDGSGFLGKGRILTGDETNDEIKIYGRPRPDVYANILFSFFFVVIFIFLFSFIFYSLYGFLTGLMLLVLLPDFLVSNDFARIMVGLLIWVAVFFLLERTQGFSSKKEIVIYKHNLVNCEQNGRVISFLSPKGEMGKLKKFIFVAGDLRDASAIFNDLSHKSNATNI